MPGAPVTSAAVGVASIDQPTTRRESAPGRRRSRPCPPGWGARCCRSPAARSDRCERSCARPGRWRSGRAWHGATWPARWHRPARRGAAAAHGVVADLDPAAKPQLGMHPKRPVGAARALVDLDDQIGQPGMADRPLGRRARSPGVGARGRHVQHPAGDLDRDLFGGHHRDRLVLPFGGTTARTSSIARRSRAARSPARRCAAWPPPARSSRRCSGPVPGPGRCGLAVARCRSTGRCCPAPWRPGRLACRPRPGPRPCGGTPAGGLGPTAPS